MAENDKTTNAAKTRIFDPLKIALDLSNVLTEQSKKRTDEIVKSRLALERIAEALEYFLEKADEEDRKGREGY